MHEFKQSHVFICGLHRSGTSLVHRILAGNEDFSGFEDTGVPEDEGQHLQSVMTRAYEHGGPGKFALDKRARLDENSSLLSQKETLKQEWNDYWDTEKQFLIEKSPINLIRTRFLQEVYPDAHFIVVKRHPLAVAMATQKWSKNSIYELVEHWLIAYEIWEEDSQHIAHNHTLRYEDLMSAPSTQLNQIGSFLNTDITLPEEITLRTGINDKYFKDWNRTFNPERWFREKKILHDFEKRTEAQGYQLLTSG